MGLKIVHHHRVEWGDADPARIVFFPNYFRWFDAASHTLQKALGFDLNLMVDQGYIGFPLIEVNAKFKRPSVYADILDIEAEVTEVGEKTFRTEYRVRRDGQLLVDGWDTRFLGKAHPEDRKRAVMVNFPDEIRAMLLREA
jgi:4-hydroxybenzoyl-CoA thioesterase